MAAKLIKKYVNVLTDMVHKIVHTRKDKEYLENEEIKILEQMLEQYKKKLHNEV